MTEWTTVKEVAQICEHAAKAYRTPDIDYRLTAEQVTFFVLVRIQKQGHVFNSVEDILSGLNRDNIQAVAAQITQFLAEWGEIIDGLKSGNEKEWELLRIQMEKGLTYLNCPAEDKADALQDALWKIFGLLEHMVDLTQITSSEFDLVTWIVSNKTRLSNIYDFSSPFYAFAKTVARNRLLSILRGNNRDAERTTAIDDLPAWNQPSISEAEAMATEVATHLRKDLHTKLAALFNLIDTQVTRKPRLVLYHTFAIRAQFWELIWFTKADLPPDIPKQSASCTSDIDIAERLNMKKNSVRVNRNHARKQVHKVNAELGELLDNLMRAR